MNIALTPEQQNLIQSKIQTGKYESTQQVIEVALRLFEKYEQAESYWSKSVQEKNKAAVNISEQSSPIDGEIFVEGILQRF